MFGFKAHKASSATLTCGCRAASGHESYCPESKAQSAAANLAWFTKASQDDYESDLAFYGPEKAAQQRAAAQDDLAARLAYRRY